MSTASASHTRRFPLQQLHLERGAKFGSFGIWEVPLYYTSILEEHEAVRKCAGLFDISHMGEFFISGHGAEKFLQEILPRDISSMEAGKALYMPLLNDQGRMIDDIILYRFDPDRFLIIVNAANIEKDFKWFQHCQEIAHVPKSSYELKNQSDEKGLLALQGPNSIKIINRALGTDFSDLAYYHCREWKSGMVARTGYTGEDGFEIMVNQNELHEIWDALFQAGTELGLVPAGFGARDTLRLEAGMLLYGHDMDDERSPLEAGIGWAVDFKKPSFTGREALLKDQHSGIKIKLIGFEMIERGVPRQEYTIQKLGNIIGRVTSGSFSPTLQKSIGMGYVSAGESSLGNEIEIVIRDKPIKAKIVKLPFYKRPK